MAKGNVGDRIRVVDADGYSDYINGDEGVIIQADTEFSGADIRFDKNEDSNYLYGHEYEILQEESSATEEAIPWAVGQEVFCLLRGKGVVFSVQSNQSLWECGVTVLFEKHGQIRYALDGKVSPSMNRSLFFSDPQIIADKLPPKKPFIPVLKKGDVIVLQTKIEELAPKTYVYTVEYETEDEIYCFGGHSNTKVFWTIHKLGDKVEFNV